MVRLRGLMLRVWYCIVLLFIPNIVLSVEVPYVHEDRAIDYFVYLQQRFTFLQLSSSASATIKQDAGLVAQRLWLLRLEYEQRKDVKATLKKLFSELSNLQLFSSQKQVDFKADITDVINKLFAIL